MAKKKDLKTIVYDQSGKEIGDMELPNEVFGVEVNPLLMAQAVRVYLFNQKRGTANTKTRAEVSGGGKKPWKQKGTGRARHGSIRSPIWVKGGISHGPRAHKTELSMSKKMKKKALFSSLSKKFEDKEIKILDNIKFAQPKTKDAKKIISDLGITKSTLFILPKKMDEVYLSFRNLPRVESVVVDQINSYIVLNHKNIIFLKDSVSRISKVFLKSNSKNKDKETESTT